MSSITYIVGDATQPVRTAYSGGYRVDKHIVCHVCNTVGGWGAGFTGAISKRWPQPEQEYRNRVIRRGRQLGDVDFVPVEADLIVANMVAQEGIGPDPKTGKPPIRYQALETCLLQVGGYAARANAAIHMPRIGCDRAGGSWSIVGRIIEATMCNKGVRVVVYDLQAADAARHAHQRSDQVRV